MPTYICSSLVVHKHKLTTLTSIPWTRQHRQETQESKPQGQRSKEQYAMPKHTYPSCVVHTPNSCKVTWILWPQLRALSFSRCMDRETDWYRAPAFSPRLENVFKNKNVFKKFVLNIVYGLTITCSICCPILVDYSPIPFIYIMGWWGWWNFFIQHNLCSNAKLERRILS